jgi:hypothetical protein
MTSLWQGFGCKSMRVLGILLAVAWLLLVLYALVEGASARWKDLVILFAIGVAAVGVGAMFFFLGKNRAVFGILIWNLLVLVCLFAVFSNSRNDIVKVLFLLSMALYAAAVIAMLRDKPWGAGSFMIWAGILTLPIGIFTILFGLRLHRIEEERQRRELLPESPPAAAAQDN